MITIWFSYFFILIHLSFFLNFWVNFFLILWNYLIIYFYLTNNLRIKLYLFFLNVLVFTFWGVFYNLDGLCLIILQSELILIYFFTLILTQLKLSSLYLLKTDKLKNAENYIIYMVLFQMLSIISNMLSTKYTVLNLLVDYYLIYPGIVASDFFYLFYFFFFEMPVGTIILGIIITLLSCFFIFFFKSIQISKNYKIKNLKLYYFLRKQNFFHQTSYNNFLKFFSKI